MKGSALERFAQEARIQLQKEVRARLNLIQKGDASIDLIENRNAVNALNKHLEELKGDEEALVEEVAYTWFNRISALRFMDASGYNATLIVSPAEGKTLPEILSEALSGIIDEDVVTSTKDQERIRGLVDGSITSKNPQAEIYRILLVASCNHLNNSLPLLFEKIEDYTDLLLPDDLLSSESIITKTVNAISEDDTESVEIIGWLYQYYISEKKDEVFASFKKGKKAGKDEIPAATQLFTPEWIVRYLVENSLGRLWMLNHPESNLKNRMKYYIEPADKETDFIRLDSPEEIKVLDPCCGSGHMLTYAFDLLFDIYTECGYTDNDAVKHIIEDNLYGIEIDKRAGQLAYFALMMKARERSRRILRKGISPNICILQKVVFDKEELPNVINLFENPSLTLMDLMKDFENTDILGSLITPSISNIAFLKNTLKANPSSSDMFSDDNTLRERVKTVLEQAEYLAGKYHVVVTNPPYMGNGNMCKELSDWAKGHYPNSKSDLFAMFMERGKALTIEHGYYAMVTMQSWMFLSGFAKFRREILDTSTISCLAHMANMVMHIAFGTSATIFYNVKSVVKGYYFRVEYEDLVDDVPRDFPPRNERNSIASSNRYYFEVAADQFEKIPGSPIAYWASPSIIKAFQNPTFYQYTISDGQNKTGDNAKYVRFFWEVKLNGIGRNKKWFFYAKGGGYRRWYGNLEEVIDWSDEARNFYHKDKIARIMPEYLWYEKGITWGLITSSHPSFRILPEEATFDVTGSSVFIKTPELFNYFLGLLNSSTFTKVVKVTSSTYAFQVNDIRSFPVIISKKELVNNLVQNTIDISRLDWDSFETSWDFSIHPLLKYGISIRSGLQDYSDDMEPVRIKDDTSKGGHILYEQGKERAITIESSYELYKDYTNKNFFELKKNEEELNRIFIDIYGLQDELTPAEDDSMVSVHRIFDSKSEIPESMKKGQYALTKEDVIKSFISYVVGCMFGRYDASRSGLAFAGGDFNISSYSDFVPDSDNVIPVLGDSWFKNDAETYFIKFVEKAFGHESLNENLKFIENALGKSIREYFYKDFYKDHLKTYQKRPIYWMFSSPKGYFQALVYMHRYNENTANVVLDYLRQFRDKIRMQIKLAEDAGETKKKVEYENIDKDLNDYEMNVLYPLAIQHLTFDLDDGVKVNYQKLGKALKPIK